MTPNFDTVRTEFLKRLVHANIDQRLFVNPLSNFNVCKMLSVRFCSVILKIYDILNKY